MDFDQYHEPPDELPAATRTFARLCASLTEEAEAIGWYDGEVVRFYLEESFSFRIATPEAAVVLEP